MTSNALSALLRRPIVVAPMGGGPTTPALVTAAADAGALGFLAAGYKSADAMKAEVAAVRTATTEAFGVNLFVPGSPTAHPAKTNAYLESLASDAETLDIALGDPAWDDDSWTAKIAVLLADPPPIVSFTFGCPPPEIVASLRAAGAIVAITVTQAQEALLATAAGAHCLCVQGIEAGAHQGRFTNEEGDEQGHELLALIREVAQLTDLPQIAAGGIMNAAAVKAVLRNGAVAAQCGTAFLRCPESGAHPAHKAALSDSRFASTAITRSFSGRPARGLVNQFMITHTDAPAAYPEINNATRPLRAAAAQVGDLDRMSLWAGIGFKEASSRPAAEIIELLCQMQNHC